MSQRTNFRKSSGGTNSQKTTVRMVGVWQRSLRDASSIRLITVYTCIQPFLYLIHIYIYSTILCTHVYSTILNIYSTMLHVYTTILNVYSTMLHYIQPFYIYIQPCCIYIPPFLDVFNHFILTIQPCFIYIH